MSKILGIDLGTANTVIFTRGKGITLREPSVVASDAKTKALLAVGDEAKRMIGKTPGSILAQYPLKDGVIADYEVTVKMLSAFFKKIKAIGVLSRPDVLVSIPNAVTEVERRAVESAVDESGAKSIMLIGEPMAAAVGAGLDVLGSRGSMIVDIGGGTTEAAVISLGGIVTSFSTNIAGNQMDRAIVDYLKNEHQLVIGESTAELLKKNIGSVHPSTDRGEVEVRARSQRTSLPVTVSINSAQIRRALEYPVNEIVKVIRKTLENTPPELSADIFDYGIMLTGGGALTGGLAQIIGEKAGVRVTVAKKPLDSVATGLGRVIDKGLDCLLV